MSIEDMEQKDATKLTVESAPPTEKAEKAQQNAADEPAKARKSADESELQEPEMLKGKAPKAAKNVETPKKEKAKEPADEGPSLKEVIKEQAIEGEDPFSSNFTLRKILGGDILNTSTIRRQIWLCLLIVGFLIIYVANRYSCQKNLIEIDRLTKELQDAKFRALSSSSQVTEKSRESNVLDMLKANNDSTLHVADQPPYIITVPTK